MSLQLDWSLSYPIKDEVLPDGFLVVKSRGTSGGGQFELAGYSISPDGAQIKARDVIGKTISFVLPTPRGDGLISLGEEYPVLEKGNKVRVLVKEPVENRQITDGAQNGRPNIGNLFASLFMLPSVSSREQSRRLDSKALRDKTYWIDDVVCKIHSDENGLILLEPVKFIFASGNREDTDQPKCMAVFDYISRLSELYEVSARSAFMPISGLKTALSYYFDVLSGLYPLDSKVAESFRLLVMKHLARSAEQYYFGDDPLPYLFGDSSICLSGFDRPQEAGYPLNWIFFGAPGTGKSYQLNELAKKHFDEDNVRRVTFYPDYTYSQFVGGYKPFPRLGEDGELAKDNEGNPTGEITYDFVPGPFMRTYVEAVQNPDDPHLLIIEEINRANPAAVFGDLFQLLDRKKEGPDGEKGRSVYDIDVPVEMKLYLQVRIPEYLKNYEMGSTPEEIVAFNKEDIRLKDETGRLSIPPNMYIWATMNSADQGVFPMDTAFKRRWEFKPMGINDGAEKVLDDGRKISEIVLNPTIDDGDETVPAACGPIVWDKLRRKINDLMKGCRVNEDKFLGPFFISPADLTDDAFVDVFKNKVLLYLFEDIGKMKRGQLFEDEGATYSELCEQFDKKGVRIFKGINPVDVAPDESVGNSQASSGDDLPASNEALEG